MTKAVNCRDPLVYAQNGDCLICLIRFLLSILKRARPMPSSSWGLLPRELRADWDQALKEYERFLTPEKEV